MLVRSIRSILKVNRRSICKSPNKSLFACTRNQIRQLSTPDPKETSPIDPFNYKVDTYHGIYEDRHGKQKAEVELDNDAIKIYKVHHLNIIGNTFTSLLPSGVLSEILARSFKFTEGTVDQYTLEFTLRIPISTNTETGTTHEEGKLHVKVAVDQAQKPSQIFQLTLRCGEHVIASDPAAKFGEALLDIQVQLPIKKYIRSCFMCAYSEYYPLNDGEFGTLGCFKSWPPIAAVQSAQELMVHWTRAANQVQESYRCAAFRRRTRPHIAPSKGQRITATSSDESTITTGAITEEKEWVK